MDMMESPAKFGQSAQHHIFCLEEDALLTPCCGGPGTLLCGDDGGNLCQNPSSRLFWDGVHLTEAAYHYMAHLLLLSIDDTTVRGASYHGAGRKAWLPPNENDATNSKHTMLA
ncbi:unnamed protein product [Triticum turgidum subsp. durum]|uniref:GDSL esterase/lipase n=1 Tax=Triticum turgidum subsp. durum TaxID=4567 RepID=A0A9R0TTZ6_TRITD|nr:unnamed protein product [Triticum turgidum subsp. durum]